MNTLPTNRQEAAELFLQYLIEVACEGTSRSIGRTLAEGVHLRACRPPLRTLHSWYADLSEGDQSMVVDLVREVARFSVFSTLVLLDGATGGRYREGKVLEFALYLEIYSRTTYTDREAVPEARIRINPIGQAVPELHDLFNDAVE
jgi:hypothetical protein